jgi:hypothetical protein
MIRITTFIPISLFNGCLIVVEVMENILIVASSQLLFGIDTRPPPYAQKRNRSVSMVEPSGLAISAIDRYMQSHHSLVHTTGSSYMLRCPCIEIQPSHYMSIQRNRYRRNQSMKQKLMRNRKTIYVYSHGNTKGAQALAV